jgi:hypothetical protein
MSATRSSPDGRDRSVEQDTAVQGELVSGTRRREVRGRWAEAVLEAAQGSAKVKVHMNPDGSGFMLFTVGDKTIQQVTWEAALIAAAGAAVLAQLVDLAN